jgi:uncharacterized protein YjiS (DUF1127 family)
MPLSAPSFFRDPTTAFFRLCVVLATAFTKRRQRRQLLTLDERLLKDMGISRCDAEREAAKGWRQ